MGYFKWGKFLLQFTLQGWGEGVGRAPHLTSKALNSPFTSISCLLLYYSVPQASKDACGAVPGSSGIAMLLTPQQALVLAATLDQMLCGTIPSGRNSPFSAVSGCCWTDLHSPGRQEVRGVRGRDLLCVSADTATPTHSPCGSQNCIQSSEVAEAKCFPAGEEGAKPS